MRECRHLKECEFVLRYVAQVKPHWDDFVTLYCYGDFQGICKRLEQFNEQGACPDSGLMPTGRRVPRILEIEEFTPVHQTSGAK